MRRGGAKTALRIRDRGTGVVLLAALALLPVLQAEAQEEGSPAPILRPTHPTSLESYLERPGILLVKRHHALAPVPLRGGGEMRLDAVAAHQPGMEHQRVMGIRIELDRPDLAAHERIFFIDLHEIEQLVRAIDFMKSAMDGENPTQGTDRTEMAIATRDGLEVGVRFTAEGAGPFVRAPSASFAIQRHALELLRSDLDDGRAHLFSE